MIKMDPQNETVTDEALAEEAARGDRAAFDEIVRRYCRPLVQFITGRAANVQDAEDIVQETFLKAYQHIDSFDGRYAFKSWLFTIAYRVAVSVYRKKRPHVLSHEAIGQIAETPAEQASIAGGIWDEVHAMRPDDRTVLWLRYKQDMDIEQIAGIMGKTQTGVRVHLHRARNRLAKRIVQKESAPMCGFDSNDTVSLERTH